MKSPLSPEKHIQKSFVLQHDQNDCGVACLLSIIRYHGGNQSLERLRELCGTHITGTTLLGLYQCATKLGFETKGIETNFTYLKQQSAPCILHVISDNNLSHYVVFYKHLAEPKSASASSYLIGDPGKGLVVYSEAELSGIWKSGTALLLEPKAGSIQSSSGQKSKWRWFKDLISEDINILCITIALGLGITMLGLSTAIFTQKLIDNILPKGDLDRLITGMILLFIILLIKSALTFLRQRFILQQSKDFNERIAGNFLEAIFYLPKSFFDHRKTGDLTARLNDTQRIQKNISYIAGTVCIDILVTIVTIGFLFVYSVPVALLSLCFIPVIVFTVLSFVSSIKSQQLNVMTAYSSTESSYVDHIQGISTIKENNREGLFSNVNKHIFNQYQHATLLLGNIGNKFSVTSEILGAFMIIIILTFSSYLVIQKEIKLGEMIAILSMVSSLLPSVHRLAQTNLQIQEARVAFDRMFEFVSINPEYDSEVLPSTDFELMSLDVRGVSFGFPGRKSILENVSFNVKKGELIALIGESGCGKSTMLQILQRFYEPQNGTIRVNNQAVDSLDIPSWRTLISTVPQDIKLFNTSLVENVTLGEKLDSLDDFDIFCRKYGFDKYFSAFPHGYLTLVGEEGVNLSGGQKQLVGIARALFKKPQLLLLDEASSAMDRSTERFVFSLLQQLREELAVVMVSHKISNIKIADRIYIIEDGVTIDEGTHSTLSQKDNLYSRALADL